MWVQNKEKKNIQYKGFQKKKKNPPLFPHLLCNSERLLKQFQMIEDNSQNPIPMVRSKQCRMNLLLKCNFRGLLVNLQV